MNKLFAVVLSLMLVLSAGLTAFAEEDGLTLYYPSYMQASEGETLVLAEKPERIVCLSNAALQILVRCDIHPIAVTSLTSSVTYPDWVQELPQITVSMNSLDMEALIAMEPDLVIMGYTSKDAYGVVLEALDIPVYYVDAGHTVSYELMLGCDPDVVLAVGMSPSGEAHKALMLEDFENNHDDWYAIEAIANGNMIGLPVTYCSTVGINIIDNLNALADLIMAHFAQ